VALEALARDKAQAERAVHQAPTKPPPTVPKHSIAERPSEQTRIFSVNLQDPQLKRSEAPAAIDGQQAANAHTIPLGPKVPTGFGVAMPGDEYHRESSPHSLPLDEQTRAYSAETIQQLLVEKGAELTTTPNASVVEQDDDVTRIYSHPPVALLHADESATLSDINHDDITRTYDSPLEALKQERDVASLGKDVTSPGRRVGLNGQPLVIIQPEPQVRSKRRYVFLGLFVVAATLAVGFRSPIAKQSRALWSLVNLGVDSTQLPAAAVNTPVAVPLVNLSISVAPADARLKLDGVAVPNPFVVQRRSDKLPHELVAEAPGYQPLKRNLQFERDLTVMLGLSPAPQPAATTEPPKTAGGREADVAAAPVTVAPASAAPTRAKKAVVSTDSDDMAKATPPKASKGAACAMPYTIDENGIKTFKPECI
jgi:hypothetical protein